MNEILARMRLVIQEKGLSDTAFAKQIGLNQSTLSNFFQRDVIPRSDVVAKITSVFDVNSNWILTGEGDMFHGTSPLVPAQQEATRKVPLIRQKASAGPGAEWNSGDNVEAYLDPLDLLPSLAHLKPGAFRVAGSSMAGAGISDGDVVLFDPDGNGYYPDDFYVFALDGDVYVKHIVFEPLTGRADIFSVFEHEGQRLLKSLDLRDEATLARFRMIGRVVAWLHDNTIRRKSYPTARAKTSPETREKPLENR